jgi:hypothetical protein
VFYCPDLATCNFFLLKTVYTFFIVIVLHLNNTFDQPSDIDLWRPSIRRQTSTHRQLLPPTFLCVFSALPTATAAPSTTMYAAAAFSVIVNESRPSWVVVVSADNHEMSSILG